MGEKTSRRDFLRKAVIGGVAISGIGKVTESIAVPAEPKATGMAKSRVISVTNKQVLTADGDIAKAALNKMVGQGVAKLAGASTAATAWKQYFKPDDVVGIKVNCLFGKGVSTHPEVVDAVVAGLITAGVKAENIIIWDRSTNDLTKSGYTINKDGKGPRCYANDGDWGDEVSLGGFKGRLTKILTEEITALINIPILKTHGIAGISCALKNHYGTINNPGDCHGGDCDPYLADINALPAIKDKTRLVVVDAIRPLADGGPGLRNPDMLWDHHTVLVSADPVAVDYIGWRIIEERRKAIGLKPLEKPSKWLATATARGLGNSDPSKIDLIKV